MFAVMKLDKTMWLDYSEFGSRAHNICASRKIKVQRERKKKRLIGWLVGWLDGC